MTEHTKTPWYTMNSEGQGMMASYDESTQSATIAITYDHGNMDAQANAAFIVQACNAHDALVEALERIAAIRIKEAPEDLIETLLDMAITIAKNTLREVEE